MPALAELYEPITADLQRVCQVFDDELFSELPVVNELIEHVRQYRGKLLRPALVLLTGRACGTQTDEHITLAAVVEMVHMATLVHDDVLDEADMRRRSPTINMLRGNEAAILLGDYLISHAFHLCSALDSQYASRTIGAATNVVCEGELHQVHHRGDIDLRMDQYLEIITRKTASLIGTCCKLGAHYAGADEQTAHRLERYGLDLGVAFQITDDVLDIAGQENHVGKTLGRDLEELKLTLPVIHSLNTGKTDHVARLRSLLAQPQPDRDILRELLLASDSIDYSLRSASQHVESAICQLQELPPSEARETLNHLARMVVNRDA